MAAKKDPAPDSASELAGRPTRANGRATRQAILDAALEVFAERGYRGASLTHIADRVGMTQPGLLHHFGTKDALLLEVVRIREAQTEIELDAVSGNVQGKEQLAETIAALAKINEAAPVQQLLLTTLSAEAIPVTHPLHSHFVNRYRKVREDLILRLQAQQEQGIIRSDVDPVAVAREFIATLDGLHLQWLLDPDEVELTDALRSYAERVSAELTQGQSRPRKWNRRS